MEPVDPRMGDLLSGSPSGGPEELRSIVSRAGRARTRLAAGLAGVALAVGGGIGYGISSATTGGAKTQIVATGPSGATASGVDGATGAPMISGASPGGGAPGSSAIASPLRLQKLFTRHTGSIDIRGFLSVGSPGVRYGASTGAVPACFSGRVTSFQAEVSTPDLVGTVSGFLVEQQSASKPIVYARPNALGFAEGAPIEVVVAETTSDVALVRVDFTGGGSDQMAPVQGWSALAAPYAGSAPPSAGTYGTLTAFDKAGKVLGKQTVGTEIEPPLPFSPNPGSPGSVHGSPGYSGSGSASAGSGSASAGSNTASPAGTSSSAVSSPPASVVSPPATGPSSSLIYPCKAVTLPAQVVPNSPAGSGGSSAGSAPGSGG